jgi:hypothetical protein
MLSLIATALTPMQKNTTRPVLRKLCQTFMLGITAVLAAGPLQAQTAAADPAAACSAKNQSDSAKVGTFTFIAYASDAGACLQVVSGGKVVFRHAVDSFQSFTLGQPAVAEDNIPAVANGTDVTGRGHPDMIVSLFSGGAHCCTSHLVFELAPAFRLLATINDADDDLAHFELDPRDHRYNYYTADWTFAYWPTCFACSPSELVILRYADDANGGAFHLALDRMRKAAPSPAQWSAEVAAVHTAVTKSAVDDIGQALWGVVLDLIYAGHSDLAWKFVDAAGPAAQQKPFPALSDFCSLLKKSPYWPDLAPTLQDPPPACIGAKSAVSK